MHKKGVTEEVAKKRSRRTVKHQRGIVGLDLAAITAKKNQTEQVRAKARADAIAKAKEAKKVKEAKKEKTKVGHLLFPTTYLDARSWFTDRHCFCFSFAPSPFMVGWLQAAPRTAATAPKISKQQAKGASGPRGGRY